MSVSGQNSPRPPTKRDSADDFDEADPRLHHAPLAPPALDGIGEATTLRSTLRMSRRLGLYIPAAIVVYFTCFYAAFLLKFEFVLTASELRRFHGALPVLLASKLLVMI